MAQTLQALLALVLLSLGVLQALQSRNGSVVDSVNGELEVQARGLAAELVERAAAYPYDGGEGLSTGSGGSLVGDLAGDVTGQGSSTPEYTAPDRFGPGMALPNNWKVDSLFASTSIDDVDDFHGISNLPTMRTITDPTTGTAGQTVFTVSFTVDYVRLNGSQWVDSSISTATKRIAVQVRQGHLSEPVYLARFVTD